MKYVKQFLIIIFISMIGELLKTFINLPIPSGIYGMIILFISLVTGLIKPESVEEAGKFLVEIMPVMFIPAAVGLIPAWSVLEPVIVPVVVITCVTIITVMAVTGLISQLIIRRNSK